MTEAEAKKIGSKQGLISVGLGVLIANLIMTFLSLSMGVIRAFFWFLENDYLTNILGGIAIMFLCGHLYGRIAGKAIIIKRRNYILVGFLTGMAILLTTSFIGSWTGFFQEGINYIGTNQNPFFDYIFKPMFWTALFGLIPVLIIGIWFGGQIKKKGNKNTAHNTRL